MTETAQVKAVLFDMDDTLFDHRHSSRSGLCAVQQRYSCFQRASIDELEQAHLAILEEIHLQVLSGDISIQQARTIRMERLFRQFGGQDFCASATEAASLYREVYQASRQTVPGTIALLEALRPSVKIGIVSNNLLAEQQDKLRHLGLEGHIDALVVSEETGIAKPDARIFQVALERLQCRAEEAVMIGDAWQNDVVGARGAGMRAIWLNRFGLPCPDPSLAEEIRAFEPLEIVLAAIHMVLEDKMMRYLQGSND
jgi:putative hydrolase of the HAD superfamily